LPDSAQLVAELTRLTDRYKLGGRRSFPAFREVVQQLLALTVAGPGSHVRLIHSDKAKTRAVIGSGPGGDITPMPLNRGYLSIAISLDTLGDRGHLRVLQARFQYQLEEDPDSWVFRYDYFRATSRAEPPAHLQLRGSFPPELGNLGGKRLQDYRFPVGRPTLEGVIRLLVSSFGVPCNVHQRVWYPVLAATEREFLNRAFLPLSGPEEWAE
jgi:hypothetical protein